MERFEDLIDFMRGVFHMDHVLSLISLTVGAPDSWIHNTLQVRERSLWIDWLSLLHWPSIQSRKVGVGLVASASWHDGGGRSR